jgi:hypothetical protein
LGNRLINSGAVAAPRRHEMDEKFYKNKSVTQYLLGALPEEEAERLDELCFTDDRFAEALSAAENELVDAYVRGELAGADLARFKSYYLASSLRREKVEFAEALFLYGEGGTASAKERQGKPWRARGPGRHETEGSHSAGGLESHCVAAGAPVGGGHRRPGSTRRGWLACVRRRADPSAGAGSARAA